MVNIPEPFRHWMDAQYRKHPDLLRYYREEDEDGARRPLFYGVEVPEPWLVPLEKLFDKLAAIPGLRLLQVKEKLWELRVYHEYTGPQETASGWVTVDDYLASLIGECEESCLKICWSCGVALPLTGDTPERYKARICASCSIKKETENDNEEN